MVVFGQGSFIRAKVVVFGQELLYSGKRCCIRAKRLYSDKVIVFGEIVVIHQKWLYSGKKGCIRAKVVVFVQKWLYSCKFVLFGQ